MKGYRNMPGETAEVLRDGWFYTGDLAVADSEGYLRIVGRKKDMIIAGGYNIFPDEIDRILVEQQDSCKKGCPACSRVCPENAIIFPQHKTPGIAGAADDLVSGLKIDLSQLFGAPDAMQLAAQERDVELVRAGRQPPGEEKSEREDLSARRMNLPKDDLDGLMDALEEIEI